MVLPVPAAPAWPQPGDRQRLHIGAAPNFDDALSVLPRSFPLRLAPDLRQKLDAAAKKSGRSLQSEILARLNSTLEQDVAQSVAGTSGAQTQITVDVAKFAKLLADHLRNDAAAVSAPITPPPRPRRAPAKLK